MKKLLFVSMFLLLFACSKEKACETNGTGELCITNGTTTTVTVSINGELKGLWTSGYQDCYELPAIPANVKAAELNGSFKWNKDVNVPECNVFDLELTR